MALALRTSSPAPDTTSSTKHLRKLLGSQGVAQPLPDAKDAVWGWLAGIVANRKAGEAPKVEVLNVADGAHGWLLVVADDQPF